MQTGKKTPLFDASRAKETTISARPIEEQEERESQRLWQKCTTALRRRDQDGATDEKSRIEDMQREEATRRPESEWTPRLFRPVRDGPGQPEEGEGGLDFIINAQM